MSDHRSVEALLEKWRKAVAPEPAMDADACFYSSPLKLRRDSYREGYAQACRDHSVDLERLREALSPPQKCPDCVDGTRESTWVDDEQPRALCSTCDGAGVIEPETENPVVRDE